MAEIYFHIGTHKTGSTAIQQALRKSKEALGKEGIFYLSRFPRAVDLMKTDQIDTDLIQACCDYLNEQIAQDGAPDQPHKRYVMSFEGLSGDPLIGYKNSGVVAESLHRISAAHDVKIIIYLRRQDRFLESYYTQRIRQGESWAFKDFMGRFDASCFDWSSLLDSFADVFGAENIYCRRYGKQYLPNKDSLIKDFTSTPHVSYSKPALEIARLCNPYLEDAEKKELQALLQQIGSKGPFVEHSFFDDEERSCLLASYASSNQQVADVYVQDADHVFAEVVPSPSSVSKLDDRSGLLWVILIRSILEMNRRIEANQKDLRLLRKIEKKMVNLLRRIPLIKRYLLVITAMRLVQ